MQRRKFIQNHFTQKIYKFAEHEWTHNLFIIITIPISCKRTLNERNISLRCNEDKFDCWMEFFPSGCATLFFPSIHDLCQLSTHKVLAGCLSENGLLTCENQQSSRNFWWCSDVCRKTASHQHILKFSLSLSIVIQTFCLYDSLTKPILMEIITLKMKRRDQWRSDGHDRWETWGNFPSPVSTHQRNGL
jgi:hypothetical protein